MKIKALALGLSLSLVAGYAFADSWQLLCVPGSTTGCHSLWQTITPNNGDGTILFSYNVDFDHKQVKPSVVIDFNNMQLGKDTKFIELVLNKKQTVKMPVVASDKTGAMASFNQKYFVSKLVNDLQIAKTLTIQYKQNGKVVSVPVDMKDFSTKLDKMLHGKQLFEARYNQ